MGRPRSEQPTPAELEILKALWVRAGPTSVRETLEALDAAGGPPRAYTTVMSLLNVMADKGLLTRTARGRAYVYEPATAREPTLRSMLAETLARVYDGSTRLLITHLLDQSKPTSEELDQIRSLLDDYMDRQAK